MLIVMKPGAAQKDIERVLEIIEKLGYKAHALPGANRTAIGITGNKGSVDPAHFENLPGVADIRIFGERRYAMRIWLDPTRLAAYRVTPQDVESALRRQNIEIPAGRVESVEREFTVVSETDMRTPAEFENIILRDESGYLVRLRDGMRRRDGDGRFRGLPRYQVRVGRSTASHRSGPPPDRATGK